MSLQKKFLFASFLVFAAGCSGNPDAMDDEPTDDPNATEQNWDSQDGNPTHATHSYLTEYAIDQLKGRFPELQTYRANILDGANREIHDLHIDDVEQESLRAEFGGNNAGCDHPERVFSHATASYAAHDKPKAYWFVGILLHYVEDIGVPAHAFHVYHQSSPSNWDHFELMGFQRWSPSYSGIQKSDPHFTNPADYVAFNGNWTIADWQSNFQGVTYTRTVYSRTWLFASTRQKTFMRTRQGRTAVATKWALESAITHF